VAIDVRATDLTLAEPAEAERRSRLGLLAWGCLAYLVGLAVVAALAPLIAPFDPAEQHLLDSAVPPDSTYWLGTDTLGRDILSRLMYGARTALVGPTIVAIGAGLLGTALGLLAGFRGGRVDTVTMRLIDLAYAVPPLLVAIVVVGLFGGGYWLAVVVLIVLSAPADVRVVRSAAMAQRELPYVAAARVVGVRGFGLAVRHVLPNITPTVTANVLLEFVGGLIALSALAFLGLGVAAGTPDWGLMIAENRSILDLNPWAVIAPAILIMLTAVAMTILGDRVYDILTRRGAS
jgi:ABC-type dipeptide/oligopeptide/nickel transport system permease subunit